MSAPATSDLTRAIAGVRRRWWLPLAAALIGALLGVLSSLGGGVATAQAVVDTPSLRANDVTGVVSDNLTVPVSQLVSDVLSPDTAARLGAAVKGSALSATAATDNGSITLRVTAPTADQAKSVAKAYADDVAERYDASVKAPLKAALDALDTNIAAAKATVSAQTTETANLQSEIAAEQQRRNQLAKLLDRAAPTPRVTLLSAGNPSLSTAILLAIALGAVTAAVLGLLALFDRRLRFRDDVESVTGSGTVLASVTPAGGGWPLSSVLERLAARGPVTVVPVGRTPITDAVREGVEAAGATITNPRVENGRASGPTSGGPALLLVNLGVDSRDELDVAYRALSAADGPFAGVVTTADTSR